MFTIINSRPNSYPARRPLYLKQTRHFVLNILILFILWTKPSLAFSIDSIFEPIITRFDLLPDYYLDFDLSTFALHRDSFYKRQYLAEPHPELEFCLVSYKDLIASVWKVDFLFGLESWFTRGNSRFSKNGLAQIGIRFFN
jgi:hypothetical protein